MIDWKFIANLEGGDHLTGYVPSSPENNSGVTIASGVDLGASDPAVFNTLDPGLVSRLRPFFGIRGDRAAAALGRIGLAISPEEATAIDSVAFSGTARTLEQEFNGATSPGAWAKLPSAPQTVMVSLSYQYGSIWRRCPKFWADCIARNFQGMASELENFGDAYPTRRGREAAYLINGGAS